MNLQHVPQELLDIYCELVRSADNPELQRAHLVNMVLDVDAICKHVQSIIDNARARTLTNAQEYKPSSI
jgi:hypothetical protein